MTHAIPSWIVAAVGSLYRFVAGAFGISLPRPLRSNFCGPFWVVVFSVTVGLPIVLLGWTIRLLLGKGRANRFGEAVSSFGNSKAGKILGKAGLVGLILLVLGSYFLAFYLKYGLWGILLGIMVLVGAVTFIVGLILLSLVAESVQRKLQSRPRPEPTEQREKRLSVLKIFWWLIKLPFRIIWLIVKIIWEIFYTIGVVLQSIYKKYCPLVEFR